MDDQTIDTYAEAAADWRADAIRQIDAIVRKAAPKATGSIKWAQPVYDQNGPFAFLKANKAHVTFGFWRGTELTDPKGLLEGEGHRMKHVKVRDLSEIRKGQFTAWVKEAVELNETEGNPTKRAQRG